MFKPGFRKQFSMLAAAALLSAPLVATAIPCGYIVTSNYTLGGDITCSGNSLQIGASNIVINLNGHTITTTGSNAVGIQASFPTSGYSNVQIVGPGKIVTPNGAQGVLVSYLQGSTIKGLTFEGAGVGGGFYGGDPVGLTISGNIFQKPQGVTADPIVNLATATQPKIIGNHFSGPQTFAIALGDQAMGVGYTNGAFIQDNTIDSSYGGIAIWGGKGHQITANHITNTGNGGNINLAESADGGGVLDSTISDNYLSNGVIGVSLYSAKGTADIMNNLVERNTVDYMSYIGVSLVGDKTQLNKIYYNSINNFGAFAFKGVLTGNSFLGNTCNGLPC